MKNSFTKIISVSLMLLCCLCVFAEGSTESFSNNSIEEKTGTNKIVQDYIDNLEKYQEECEKYSVEMEMAYKKGDSDAYLKAKKALRSLEAPYLSQEDTNLALSQIVSANDVESAKLLYQTSRYYRPVLTLKAVDNGFNYSSTLSVIPGSEVTLPELRTMNRSMLFKGWGEEEGVVKYAAGETIQMPIEDKTLYAVFEADPSIVSGASIEISVGDNLTLQSNKKAIVDFFIKNNGTENLTDVEVLLESEDPLLVILDEKLSSRFVESCAEKTASYTVITKAVSGTKLDAVLTVKDSNSNVWTKNVTFTVE